MGLFNNLQSGVFAGGCLQVLDRIDKRYRKQSEYLAWSDVREITRIGIGAKEKVPEFTEFKKTKNEAYYTLFLISRACNLVMEDNASLFRDSSDDKLDPFAHSLVMLKKDALGTMFQERFITPSDMESEERKFQQFIYDLCSN